MRLILCNIYTYICNNYDYPIYLKNSILIRIFSLELCSYMILEINYEYISRVCDHYRNYVFVFIFFYDYFLNELLIFIINFLWFEGFTINTDVKWYRVMELITLMFLKLILPVVFVACNLLASIRVAQVIIVTFSDKNRVSSSGIDVKNLLSTAIIIFQFYLSY